MRKHLSSEKFLRQISPQTPATNRSLLSKVDAALAVLEDANPSNDGAAINILQALFNQIESQRGKALTDAEADPLRNATLRVLDSLQG
ncbi:MAG: hypothetical protein EXS31_04575 [Pedosphaera sp.]|nr:hypothetical protein [Pedosphaera sp.]